MSSNKRPSSLRQPTSLRSASIVKTDRAEQSRLVTGALTAACLAATFSGSAFAQSAAAPTSETKASTPLPEVSVISNAPKPKVKAKKKVAKPQPKIESEPTGETYPVGGQSAPTGAPVGAVPPGANPNAEPGAPYKVNQSGNTKLTEPLVNQPRTIVAVPKEVLSDKGVTTIRELARQTPGVTIGFAEGGNAFGDAIAIRGFSARNDIFVDGVRDPGNVAREAFSIEQVEIYKGPSGVVSGRGTPGGAVNIISKKPNLDASFYETETKIGTDSTFRQTVDINQVVTPDFAFRANLLYNTNDVAGRDYAEDERWGGLISATGKITPDVKLTLDYYRLRSDGLPDWGVPINRDTKVPFTENGLSRDTWYGNKNRDFISNESDIGTATIEAKLTDGVTLTNITRYGVNSSAYLASAPRPAAGQVNLAGPITVGSPQRDQSVDAFSNHTDVNIKFNTGSFEHTVVAGFEYSRDTIDRFNITFSPAGNAVLPTLGDPDPLRAGFITGRTFNYKATVETIGGYIGDTVKLSDQWIVDAGIRVDDFSRDQVGATAANTAYRQDTLTNWHAGIVYKPIPIASIYAAYATAQSPIGGELDSTGVQYSGLSTTTLPFEPEETKGVEVGTKWELFDRKLLATAALFQTTKDKARTNSGVAAAQNDGKYRVEGVELSVAGNITEAWSIYGGIVLMDTEVLHSDNPAEIGRRMANIPLTQFALLTSYKLTDDLRVGGQAVYNGSFYNGFFAENDLRYHSNPFWRFDAFAEYKIDNNWSVELEGINLTNELYYDAIYQQDNAFAFVAPGRSGYLTVKWKY